MIDINKKVSLKIIFSRKIREIIGAIITLFVIHITLMHKILFASNY